MKMEIGFHIWADGKKRRKMEVKFRASPNANHRRLDFGIKFEENPN